MSVGDSLSCLRPDTALSNHEPSPMPPRNAINVEDEGDFESVTYRCNVCREHFVIFSELEQHIINEHEGNLDSKKIQEKFIGVSCLNCNQSFIKVEDINHHNIVEHRKSIYHNDHEKCQSGKSEDFEENIDITFRVEENKSPQESNSSSSDRIPSNDKEEQRVRDSVRSHFHNNGSRKRRLSSDSWDPHERGSKHFEEPDQYFQSNQLKKNLVIDMSQVASIKMKPHSNCGSAEIIQYIKRVEDKLDSIIKHFNVPYIVNSTEKFQKQSFPSSAVFSEKHHFKKCSENLKIPLSHDMNTDQNSMQCDSSPIILNDQISTDLVKQVFQKSRNRGNFAKNLVYVVFSISERTGRNCYGRRGGALSGYKYPLDQKKLRAVRNAVFKMFPVENTEEEEAIWKRECVIAIDTALRGEMRNRILNIKSADNVDLNATT
ncbi:uncharacterized protein LOC100214531 [Hydra vulgaris]|uniref:Uncharacterized protein LOC100214531 n=1 Tax=Hydra vulgaris TaxID=6087 RepID=A0ABM4CGJ4_HYDVU